MIYIFVFDLDYLIAIIVVSCVLFVAATGGGYVYYKKRPTPSKPDVHCIQPDQLRDLLRDWDQNQNAGCEKEWSVIKTNYFF